MNTIAHMRDILDTTNTTLSAVRLSLDQHRSHFFDTWSPASFSESRATSRQMAGSAAPSARFGDTGQAARRCCGRVGIVLRARIHSVRLR